MGWQYGGALRQCLLEISGVPENAPMTEIRVC